MRKKYYVDNVVLSFYAGSRRKNVEANAALMFFNLARVRGRLVGSSLLTEESEGGGMSPASERKNARKLVQIFKETKPMLALAAEYASLFSNRGEADKDLRHYAAATLKSVPYFVTEDGFFLNDDNAKTLAAFNKPKGLLVPQIVDCRQALLVISQHVQANPRAIPARGSRRRLTPWERKIYNRIMKVRARERAAWFRKHGK